MYPDQIKNYTTEKEFEDHQKMLDEMKEHFKQNPDVSNQSLEKIRDEERQLVRLFKNWRKNQRS